MPIIFNAVAEGDETFALTLSNLVTGTATVLENPTTGTVMIADSASADAGPPEATLYAVTLNNQLFSFSSSDPGTFNNVVAITGLQTGERILAIDFPPATGQLYGLGSSSRLYTIDPMAGAATQVGASFHAGRHGVWL